MTERVRRCEGRRRPLAPGAVRPTDLLAAFFLTGIGFLVSGAVVAVLVALGAFGTYGHWLALHLGLLGGVSLLVLGAGQFFCTAFLATDPPGRSMVGAQLGVWSAGTVLVAVGVPSQTPALTDVGGLAVIAGLVLFAVALRRLERRSLQTARWAVRWYYTSAGSLGLGAVLGILMARGTVWTHGSLLGAHLALNLAGWLGTAIVGTLHTFFPSLTQTRLRHPRLQPLAYGAWTAGVAVLALGLAFASPVVVALGWAGLAAGAALLGANLVGCLRAAPQPLSLAPRLVGAGQGFLLAGLLAGLVVLVASGPSGLVAGEGRSVLAVLLIGGWIGLTVAGSLLHLLALLNRVRDLMRPMPVAQPRDAGRTALVVVAVAALALSRLDGLSALSVPATVATALVAAVVGARILRLAGRASTAATARSRARQRPTRA